MTALQLDGTSVRDRASGIGPQSFSLRLLRDVRLGKLGSGPGVPQALVRSPRAGDKISEELSGFRSMKLSRVTTHVSCRS